MPRLKSKQINIQEAEDVGKEMFRTEKLKVLSEDMIAIMRKAPGVGLAAPQIGVGLKVRKICFVLSSLATLSS